MKSLKTLVCVSSFALCFGAASMANAVAITPDGPFTTNQGTIVVKTPSAPGDITCNVTFGGNVAGGIATITSASLSGPVLCSLPTLKNIPTPGWVLTPSTFDTVSQTGTGVVTGVGWTIVFPASNCGPGPLDVKWDEASKTLSSNVSQPLSGNCFVRSLNVKAPTLKLQ
ncbi:protein activator of alkane oxidation PraB [Pseudomonas fluorescens]|uniref:Protein activator of alkane oxidation PraB n=1 Tax=Pseudomonas fluorescens TaxID=294 RepID=A0A379ICI0_PSEFL|nr:alkane oxidation protein activator PraB [Pseudomonas fluorescens]AIG00824.1 protein activator of alkane oxidation PraB [Pseudomonas fluorescens]SUD30498.1 protein activator of alkane oxidation PraB [Pseudomonas fluorescens]